MRIGSIMEDHCGPKQYHRAARPESLKSIMADHSQCPLTRHRRRHKSAHAHADGRKDSISYCSCLRHNRLVAQLSSSPRSGRRRTKPASITTWPGPFLVAGLLLCNPSCWNLRSHWYHACYNGAWRVQRPLRNKIQAHDGAADTHAADNVLVGLCVSSCRSLQLHVSYLFRAMSS